MEKHIFLISFLFLILSFKNIERPLEAFFCWKQMVCPEIIGEILASGLCSVVLMVNKEIKFL